MPQIRVGVQAGPTTNGEIVDIDGAVANVTSLVNAGSEAVAFSTNGGAAWTTVAAGGNAAPGSVTAGQFLLRRGVAGGYPVAVDVTYTEAVTGIVYDPVSAGVRAPDGTPISTGGGGGGGLPELSTVKTLTALTSATPKTGAFTTFPSQACTELLLLNTSGVSIQYQRGGAGAFVIVRPGMRRRIVGITNADQIGVRRDDWENSRIPDTTATVGASAITSTETFGTVTIVNKSITGGGASAFSSLACTSAEIMNTTQKAINYRTSASDQLIEIPVNGSAIVTGITNLNQIAVTGHGNVADATMPPICVEAFTSGLKSQLNLDQPVTQIHGMAGFTPGELRRPSSMRTPNTLSVGEAARGPLLGCRPRKRSPIATFTTVAETVGSTSICADVATGDITHGTTRIELTQTSVGTFRLAPATALSTGVDCSVPGMIGIQVSFPVGTSDYSVTNALSRLRVRLHTAGTPAAPTANFHYFQLSTSTHGFLNASKVSPAGRSFTFKMPMGKVQQEGTGATLSNILWADYELVGGAPGNGAKFTPHVIEFIPNHMRKASLIISCDDARASVWTVLAPMLRKYNVPACCFLDPWVSLDTTDKLTTDQCRELSRERGWQIAGQNYWQETGFAKSIENIIPTTSQTTLVAMMNGFSGDQRDTSYGSNAVTNYADFNRDAVIRMYDTCWTFQQGDSNPAAPFAYGVTAPLPDEHFATRWNGSTPATGQYYNWYKAGLDDAIANKGVFHLAYHAETDNAAGEPMVALEQLIVYALSMPNDVQIVTPEEFRRQCYYTPASAAVTTF